MLTAIDVPSKSRFDLLPVTLKCIIDDIPLQRLARKINQDVRHAHFMVQNARILGFAISKGGNVSLTDKGTEFINSSPKMRGFLLCRALLESRIISVLLEHVGSLENAVKLSKEEISDFLIENAVVSKSDKSPMQRVTTDRRATSVRRWLAWLVSSLPCIYDDKQAEDESNFQVTFDS